jgi:putative ABC transport system permease protein
MFRGLVVAQVALGVALAVPAALLGRSLAAVRGRDPGFAIEDIVVTDTALPGPAPGANPPMSRVTRFGGDVQAALAALPGVRGVALAYDLPLESNWSEVIEIPTAVRGSGDAEQQVQLRIVSPSYFETLDVALRDGRPFTDADTADRPGLALVNQAMADRIGPQVLGVSLSSGGPRFTWGSQVPATFTIVGIVENERFRGLETGTQPALYLSTAQFPQPAVSLLVRAQPGADGGGRGAPSGRGGVGRDATAARGPAGPTTRTAPHDHARRRGTGDRDRGVGRAGSLRTAVAVGGHTPARIGRTARAG